MDKSPCIVFYRQFRFVICFGSSCPVNESNIVALRLKERKRKRKGIVTYRN